MGWLKRHRVVESLTDPSSKQLSMSRICSWCFFCLDLVWAAACIAGLPPKDAYAPVSNMLAVCTGAAFGAYGVNSFGGAWQRMGGMFMSVPEPPQQPPRPKVPPKGG